MTDYPEPLTPPDCDLKDFAFMPLEVQRLRDSDLASDESPEACWAALLLWCTSWHQTPAGSIPDSDQWQAKHTGYQSRGRIDPQWAEVREGALRGWIKCSDGRLYHAVVAEKVNESWVSKLRHRWKSECDRIRKSNSRHKASLPCPTFAEYLSQLPATSVTRDIWILSGVTSDNVQLDSTGMSQGSPVENALKGEVRDTEGTGIYKNPVAVVIANTWLPSQKIIDDLKILHGFAPDWIDQQVPPFIEFWQKRNEEPRTTWDALFFDSCVARSKLRSVS
jgi:hypothetical protein